MPSIALLPVANGGQCATGYIIINDEVVATTTYCWTTYGEGGSGSGPIYTGGWFDGGGGTGNGSSGGTPNYIADEDISRSFMPNHQLDVSCSDESPVKKAAAQAAFSIWRIENAPTTINPTFKKYLIHFKDGVEVWQWSHSAYHTSPLIQKTHCDN